MLKSKPKHIDYLLVRKILIEKVFPELRRSHGFVAYGNFDSTQTSGLYAISKIAQDRGKSCGVVFWHSQDDEDFRATGVVNLAFNRSEDSPKTFAVEDTGVVIEVICRKHGLTTKWNGRSGRRIEVSGG